MHWTLFLDDIRNPQDVLYPYVVNTDFTIARSFDEAVQFVIAKGVPNFISFDHDLADEHYETGTGEKTGHSFAKWFADFVIDNNLKLPLDFKYYVHSWNPVGAENIRKYMVSFLDYYYNA